MKKNMHFEVEPYLWQEWSSQIQESSYLHDHTMISYFAASVPTAQNMSFSLTDQQNNPYALVPLFVSVNQIEGENFHEASLGGMAMGAPAIASASPSMRRKLVGAVYQNLIQVCREQEVSRILLQRLPLSQTGNTAISAAANLFDPLAFGFQVFPYHSVVIPLNQTEDKLFADISKYQRKLIKKAAKHGMMIKHFDGKSFDIDDAMTQYRHLHRLASGRVTRQEKSFDIMKGMIFSGQADLFLGVLENEVISALFCGRFKDTAFGWSQANHPDIENKFSPRHYLEWSAIKFYRELGARCYYVGVRYYDAQVNKDVSPKLASISVMKERFGGLLLPYLEYEAFLDLELADLFYLDRRQNFQDLCKFSINNLQQEVISVGDR